MRKFNLVLKIITTLYLVLVAGRSGYELLVCWNGIDVYIVGFTSFNAAILWIKEKSRLSVIYVISIWIGLCTRYIYTNGSIFDYIDLLVVAMQFLPIFTTIINYNVNSKEMKENEI